MGGDFGDGGHMLLMKMRKHITLKKRFTQLKIMEQQQLLKRLVLSQKNKLRNSIAQQDRLVLILKAKNMDSSLD